MHESSPITTLVLQQPRFLQGKQHRCLSLLGGLALLIQGCATTPPPPTPSEVAQTQAKAAYLANDYQRTLAIVEPLAIAGEPWAQYTLGYMHYYGRGAALDRQKAKQWIQRAAEQGYAPAQEALQRISSPPPKMEEDIDSSAKPPLPGAKDSTAPSRTATEEKKGLPQPSQTATHTTTAAPLATTPPPKAFPSKPAASLEQTAPATQPSAPPPQEMAPAAPAAESASPATATSMPPPETASTTITEPTVATAPPQAITSSPAEVTVADHAQAAKQPENAIKGRDWIAAQDPQRFTVQLLGGVSETAVVRFIHKHSIEQQAAYYSVTHNGQPWFSVVYGSFPSRDAAHQALLGLPSSLRKASPLIRSFRDIHALLAP